MDHQAGDQDQHDARGEVAEEWSRRIADGGVRRGPQLRPLGVSIPGAFVTGLLATALAVGAALQPTSSTGPAGGSGQGSGAAVAGHDGGSHDGGYGKGVPASDAPKGADPTPGPDGSTKAESTAKPDAPTIEPTPKPESTPKPKPTPKPSAKPATIQLTVTIKEGHPYAAWSACEGIDFAYYKLLRSTDATVTWPAGDNDKVVAAVQAGSKTRASDSSAPGGKKLWYRVFCVGASSAALRSSGAVSVQTPVEQPPTACSISLTVSLTDQTLVATNGDGSGVTLDWTACASADLAYYKVVRSSGSNPSYLPWADGSVVVAVVGPDGATAFIDHPGVGTWHYRVQAICTADGGKTLLGQTGVASVTVS
jgi:hypothetical protein